MLQGTLHALAVLALAAAAPAGAQSDWLSLCGKCLSPSITSKSGIGTSNAVAEGRTTRRDAEGWCANWEPGKNQAACVRDQLAAEDAKKTYRAVADCPGGKITAIDGQTYTLAGKWTSDVGKGRTRWRDAGGNIVGQDNASNGLAISQQWEVLCPVSVATARPAARGPGRGRARQRAERRARHPRRPVHRRPDHRSEVRHRVAARAHRQGRADGRPERSRDRV